MQNAKIDNYLKLLLNQPLLAIGRASNMLWVGFGKEIECTNFRGQKVKKAQLLYTYNRHGELSTPNGKK